MCILSILRLSPQWEQERLPLYLLLLIRGQHGQAVTQRSASGLDGGTQGGTAAGRLTQRDLAKRLGRSHSFVGKIESGERQLNVLEFCELADALGVDPKRLFAKVVKPGP